MLCSLNESQEDLKMISFCFLLVVGIGGYFYGLPGLSI